MRSGTLQSEVLQWLRDDVAFKGTAVELGWDFVRKRSDRFVENGRKCEIAGHNNDRHKHRGLTLNGLDCKAPMPARVQAWIRAWKEVNKFNIQALDDMVAGSIAGLSRNQQGRHGRDLRCGDAADWIGWLGSLQVMAFGFRVEDALLEGG